MKTLICLVFDCTSSTVTQLGALCQFAIFVLLTTSVLVLDQMKIMQHPTFCQQTYEHGCDVNELSVCMPNNICHYTSWGKNHSEILQAISVVP